MFLYFCGQSSGAKNSHFYCLVQMSTEIQEHPQNFLCLYSYGAYECALLTHVLAPDLSWVFIKLLESTKKQRKFVIFDKHFLYIQGEIQKKKDGMLSHNVSSFHSESFKLIGCELRELDVPA